MNNPIEQPRYRTTKYTFVDGAPYYANSEVVFLGWPKAEFHLEPINEIAERIAAYHGKHRLEPFLPKSPRDSKTGNIYLPAYVPAGPRSMAWPNAIVSESDARPGMPRYRVTSSDGFAVGSTVIPAGTEFAYLWWPEEAMGLEPVNDAARAVVAAYEEIAARKMSITDCPWNEYDGSLWLPKMQPMRERAKAAEAPQPQRPSERDMERLTFKFTPRGAPPPDPEAGWKTLDHGDWKTIGLTGR